MLGQQAFRIAVALCAIIASFRNVARADVPVDPCRVFRFTIGRAYAAPRRDFPPVIVLRGIGDEALYPVFEF